MKKFLSMLLALSVVFTYTFGAAGSVFAAETPAQQIDAKAVAQQKVIDDAVQKQLDAVVYGQDGYLFTIVSETPTAPEQKLLTAAALAEGAKAAKAAGANAIAEEVRAQKLANVYTEDKFTKILAGTIYNVAAYTAQFNAEKVAKDVEIAKIDANAYVAFDYDPATGDQSEKAVVAANIAAAKTALNAEKIADTDKEADIAKKIETVKAIKVATPAKTAAEYQKDLDDAKTAAKKAINEQAEALKKDLKEKYQDAVKKATTPSAKAEAEAKLAAVDANVAKVADIYLAKVDAVVIDEKTSPAASVLAVGSEKTDALAKLANETNLNTVLSQLSNVDGLVAVANDKAAAFKVERDTDGTIKYESAVVDKALTAVVAKIKAGNYTTISDVNGATEWTMTTIKGATAALAKYKVDNTKTVKAISTTGYADAEVEKIDDLKKAAVAAIDAAASEAAIDDIVKKLNEDIKALPTSAQTAKLTADANTAITTLKYDVALGRLFDATVLGAAAGTYDDNAATKTSILNDAKKVMVDAVLAGIDATKAYTVTDVEAIVKANYDAAKAVVTGMPTVAAVEALVAEAVAKIDAIPSTVTLADKATVEAAVKAVEAATSVAAYATLPSTKKIATAKLNNLTSATTVLQGLEKKALLDAVKALTDKLATLTAADQAAYEAAKAQAEAYAKDYAADTTTIAAVETDLGQVKGAIENSNYVAAAKAIEAIPAEVTLEAKPVVEAARKAYDALTDAQKATFSKDLVKVLESAEAKIAELSKYTDKDVKADLLDMSRKVTIWRTSKTSIRVTAVGSVANITDNGYTVKYTFYKKAPGDKAYKAIKTTTSNKYTYTNLKKGTNKFQVKVKVYDAEGKLVASKMTYYRAAKVK